MARSTWKSWSVGFVPFSPRRYRQPPEGERLHRCERRRECADHDELPADAAAEQPRASNPAEVDVSVGPTTAAAAWLPPGGTSRTALPGAGPRRGVGHMHGRRRRRHLQGRGPSSPERRRHGRGGCERVPDSGDSRGCDRAEQAEQWRTTRKSLLPPLRSSGGRSGGPLAALAGLTAWPGRLGNGAVEAARRLDRRDPKHAAPFGCRVLWHRGDATRTGGPRSCRWAVPRDRLLRGASVQPKVGHLTTGLGWRVSVPLRYRTYR